MKGSHRLRALLGKRDEPVPFEPDRVDLFYWRSSKGVNFGDFLSNVVVSKMLCAHDIVLEEETPRPSRLLAIGSILHFARDGDIVWGSGVNGKVEPERHVFETLDVRAVRGPRTRDFLRSRGIDCPEIFGDPGLLVADLMPRRFPRDARRGGVAYVPNLHDLDAMRDWPNVVSPLDPWASVVRRIAESEQVVASSLHGLVIADAFGVPCSYLRLSETEPLFKYEDYVLGAGRGSLSVATSREDALQRPMDPPKPHLDALKAAFPLDLWYP